MADAIFSKMSEEMMAQILSRLPPKSLMRFKCVRKSWHALITGPKFSNLHLSNANSAKNKLSSASTAIVFKRFVLESRNTGETEIILSSFDLCFDHISSNVEGRDHDHDHLPHALQDLKIPSFTGLESKGNFDRVNGIEISSHCDGILCLTDYKKYVALCNPAIKEFQVIPDSEIVRASPDESPIIAVGFGSDLKHNTRNYKLVRLVSCGKKQEDNRVVIHPPRAEVCTLGGDSWKEVELGNIVSETGYFLPHCSGPVYRKGVVYWFAMEQVKEYSLGDYTDDDEDDYDEDGNYDPKVDKYLTNLGGILSFDLSDEVFDIVSYPPDVNRYHNKTFAVWNNESIAIVVHALAGDPIDIWVKEGADSSEDSWIKYMAFEPESALIPLALGKSDDQVLLVGTDGCVVIFYNVNSRKFKYLVVHGIALDRIQAVVCASSIVSIKG